VISTIAFSAFLVYALRLIRRGEALAADLKKALESVDMERNRADAVLAAIGDAVSVHDQDLKVIFQNPAHRQMMGESVGRPCYQAYRGLEVPCEDCPLLKSLKDGRIYRADKCATLPSGRTVEVISSPLTDGSGRIIAGIETLRDITDRIEYEQQLVAMNHDLEMFCYGLSHDIATPLTEITFAADALGESACSATDKKNVESVIHGCTAIHNLVSSMLTLCGISRKPLRRAPLDLTAMAEEVVLGLQMAAPEREVEVRVQPGLTADGDEELVRLVLTNLLQNAFKYTPAERPARVEVGACEREGEKCFFVRDHGIGFDPAHVSLLFRPFQRLPNAAGFRGTGVGLSIVERAVSRHGGTISAEGAPGEGATFFFTLPPGDAAPPPGAAGKDKPA
ncbi:MAG TPA: ATP-binding protein, partial [Verrucomicrobiae bacterium]|nr:ATP-binding protein [Verrucomicrobiae bacterium]